MGFTLTVPRPKRAVMPIVYYCDNNNTAGGSTCGATGGSYGSSSNSSCSGSSGSSGGSGDYAGVFESGCDPVAMRASLQARTTPSARRFLPTNFLASTTTNHNTVGHNVDDSETSSSTTAGGPGAGDGGCGGGSYGGELDDDDFSDCLFAMEDAHGGGGGGPDTLCSEYRAYSSRDTESRGIVSGTERGGYQNPAKEDTMGYGVQKTSIDNGGGIGGCGVRPGEPPKRGVVATAAAGPLGITPPTPRSEKLVIKNPTHLRGSRVTPRVIAPSSGRRCSAPGMYRLRLSTSC